MSTSIRNTVAFLSSMNNVPDIVLFMYAISGDLPDPIEYQKMSKPRRNHYWASRLEKNLGPNYIHFFKEKSIVGIIEELKFTYTSDYEVSPEDGF